MRFLITAMTKMSVSSSSSSSSSSCLLLISLMLLAVSCQGRPDLQHRNHKSQLADLFGVEVAALLEDAGAAEGSSGEQAALNQRAPPSIRALHPHFGRLGLRDDLEAEPPAENKPHRRLLKDFMSSRKMFRGRTKKMQQGRGCFGMKLDRIGSMSGLGC
ncbi:C-type natriuretic peptide-like [Acipenser ruthenus]|uniref:C-type natriuretic peptide-like n=1 Tax=Acipenser ruthenus TaxID=7906 RepID=UPI002741B212|nr:C-type natriuretic peptide-like [Acipenser ruthenus]